MTVKGKGQLMTYYLLGKAGKITPPTAPVSPIIGISLMEPVAEEDESHDSPTSKSDDKTVIECSNGTNRSEEDVFNGDIDGTISTQPLIRDDDSSMKESCENTLLLGDSLS